MYTENFKEFENIENLAGKAWQHAVNIDFIESSNIKDCSMHCFHYQQILELFIKYLLEIKSKFGAFSHTHNLNKLLEELIYETEFKIDKTKYLAHLQTITVCAEQYRYNFLIDCSGYLYSVKVCNELLDKLLDFHKKI